MNAKWISCDSSVVTPCFVKEFYLDEFESAKIDVSGLGYFTLLVNGKKVSDDLFTPALTDYCERDYSLFAYPLNDKLSHRVHYLSYDITDYLTVGNNTVSVIVGNGFYRQRERLAEGKTYFSDNLITAFEITVKNKDASTLSIATDSSERCFVYPILKSDLFTGELIDTTMFLKDLEETPVMIHDFSPERLVQQTCLPDRAVRSITPELINVSDSRRVYDAGENITGYAVIKVSGKTGAELTVRYSEVINGDELDFGTTGGHYVGATGKHQIQSDTFILNGTEQTLSPMFVWHGFRFFEVLGEADILSAEVCVIHTDVKVNSYFECDDEVLNWLYDAYIRSQLGNYHGCIPSDCPHRERLGYTGDGQLCSDTAMLLTDSKELYKKWIDDILDCQNKTNGHVQHTAPFMGGGGGPGGWGGAMVFVPYNYYKHYGDVEMLKKTYPAMKKWLSYMLSRCEDGLLVSEEPGGWCLGEWATNGDVLLPEPFVNTCLMIKQLELIAEISDILNTDDAGFCLHQAELCRKALEKKYLSDGSFFGGVQAADAFAVYAGLGDKDSLLSNLVDKYTALGRLDVGIFGADILPEVLIKNGHADLAVSLMASKDETEGFNFMMKNGATTLYELPMFCPSGSYNHPMFGACVRQLFYGLLGIKPQKVGSFGDVVIEPCLDSVVSRAKGSITTCQGVIEVGFSRDDVKTTVDVTLAEGIRAVLRVNSSEILLKSGKNSFEF